MNTKMMALALMTLAGTAMAQPASFTDLGNHTTAQTFSQDVTLLAPNDIQWFRIVLPAVNAAAGYVDIWTAAVGDITDSEIALYDASGNGAGSATTYFDDDSGPGLFSQLTFGSTTARTNLGNGAAARNGSDGVLAGGVYYLGVGRYNVTWSVPFGATSTYAGTQTTTQVTFEIQPATEPYPPTGSGSATPSSVEPTQSILFTVTVVPGGNPTSTGITVTGDLSSLGGSASTAFNDSGLNGDVQAGDGIYSRSYTVPAGTAGGAYTIPVTIADAQARTGSVNITAGVFNPLPLGTLVDGTATTTTVDLIAGEVKWYRFTNAECSAAAMRNLLVTTANSTNGGDSEIAVFDTSGTLNGQNDDAVGLYSRLLFGYQGTAGDLAAGDHFVAVSSFNATFANGFVATSTGPGGSFQLDLLQTNSFPATATDTATSQGGGQFLLAVTVTPGVNPNSTGIAVTGDLSSMGGSASTAFHDDGANGDVAAGDNIFSFLATAPAADPEGQAYSIPYTVTDQQGANISGTLDFVNDRDNAGDTIATANIPAGSGELTTIEGFFGPSDVDMYKINICDAANFSATTVGGTTADTQLFLFDENGMGITFNDDSTGLQSTLTAQFVTSSGNYYIAVSRYDIDPVDADGNALWIDTPFGTERQPDGPGAANAFVGWQGVNNATAAYTITFTGTCYPTNNTQCSVADVGMAGGVAGHDRLLNNNDFIAFITLFFASDPQADMGMAGGLPGSDGQWNNNDFIAFIGHFFNDAANCNG